MVAEVVDNGASMAGVYGLANNHYAAWLINRGYGELLALTPAEFKKPEPKGPSCTAPKEEPYEDKHGRWKWRAVKGQRCGAEMRLRPAEWACYEHKTPVKKRRSMRLQQIPAFPGGLDALAAAADKTVEVKYWTPEPGRIPPRWCYFVDGELCE